MSTATRLLERRVRSDCAELPFVVCRAQGTTSALVVCLHGTGIDARRTAWLTRMATLAERASAVVVFPQATDEEGGAARQWERERDLPRLAAVIAAARREFGDGGRRVCLAGISSGAWMACWYAAAHADEIGALAAVAGLRAPSVQPSRPLPVIAFHGLRDRHAPYAGGRSERWRESVPEATRAWAAANALDGDPVEDRHSETLTETSYGKGTPAEVKLWTFARAGHTWPGSRAEGRLLLQLFHGRISVELDATDEIWRFFTDHAG